MWKALNSSAVFYALVATRGGTRNLQTNTSGACWSITGSGVFLFSRGAMVTSFWHHDLKGASARAESGRDHGSEAV